MCRPMPGAGHPRRGPRTSSTRRNDDENIQVAKSPRVPVRGRDGNRCSGRRGAGLAAPALAGPSAPARLASITTKGPGYPPPKGIYAPFINCPLNDPTFVLALTGAVATDSTFAAPGVTGCGPGGVANVAVDDALDASTGLPAAPGTNSLTLTGNFDVGATTASEDSSLPQPQDDASDLLAAFKASTNGEHSVKHLITMSQMKSLLTPSGNGPRSPGMVASGCRPEMIMGLAGGHL